MVVYTQQPPLVRLSLGSHRHLPTSSQLVLCVHIRGCRILCGLSATRAELRWLCERMRAISP